MAPSAALPITKRESSPIGDPSAVGAIDAIRAQFPALQREHGGEPVAYFDGPGGTQVPQRVVDAVADYLIHHNANTHWNYPTSAETDRIIDESRAAVADFVGGDPAEVVFGANATTLAFHVSRALGPTLALGDEVIVTELDHHANVGPWEAVARERKCELRVVRMDPQTGTLDWSDFERKMSKRTRLVAIGAASNALGTINDVARMRGLAKSVGALTFVDAVHYVPHLMADVRAWDCDFLVCSAYKFYGPHIGALWCRRDLLETLPFPKVQPAPDRAPDRAETGTLSHEGMAGTTAAIDFLASLAPNGPTILAGSNGDVSDDRPRMGRLCGTRRDRLKAALAAVHERGWALARQMWDGLNAIDGVTLFGPPPDAPRTSTVSFTVQCVPSSQVATKLAERGVFVSHGNFYAATVVERLGLGREGLVRAGCACYTTAEEVDRLIAGVRQIAAS